MEDLGKRPVDVLAEVLSLFVLLMCCQSLTLDGSELRLQGDVSHGYSLC